MSKIIAVDIDNVLVAEGIQVSESMRIDVDTLLWWPLDGVTEQTK